MTLNPKMVTVVTGATTGVGLAIATELARAGHRVVIGARDPERLARAVERVRTRAADAEVEAHPLDLASLASIARFASALSEPIDRLVLNAGVMALERRTTLDGFESMIGTNALGHFALTAHLVDRLRASGRGRIVTQSSESHRSGRIRLDDLHWEERPFAAFQAYHDSKAAQHVLAVELARRVDYVESVVCQPGWVASELGREMSASGPAMRRLAFRVGNALIGQTPEEGARSAIRAVLDAEAPLAKSGRYLTPTALRRLRGTPVVDDAHPDMLDSALGAELWETAVALTGLDPSRTEATQHALAR
jgi:NAD(P)-dependent dehydrogenase (short-subunit alcohol dehydrogenase family)